MHLGIIWIISIRNVLVFSTISNQKINYFHLFCIQFFKQRVSIAFQHALKYVIKRKIALASDACYTPPIIIRSHDLHAGDIKRVVNEITSYHKD
jgi:hypothetical protein